MSDQEDKNLFVRVKIEEEFRFVTVNENDNDVKSFLTAGLSTFGIDLDDDIEIEMFDHYNTPISSSLLNGLIRQYAHSSSFYVRLNLLRGKGSILLPKEVEKYLIAEKCHYILSEYAVTKQLTSKTVLSLCDKLLVFIKERDPKISKSTVENVCQAVIKIFPCLKWEPSKIKGIDVLYDHANRKGALYQKIVYARAKERRFQHIDKKRLSQNETHLELEDVTEDQQTELILFFKTCVVHNNREELKLKMKETVNFRRKLILAKETRFPELFPFYFVDADLILYDFQISFSNINSNVLLENWQKIKHLIINNIFEAKRDAQFLVDFDEDTAYFLLLAKHLCSKKGFDPQKFLVFCDDLYKDPRELKDSKIANPIILAIGESKTKISNYYIVLEQELLTAPPHFNFIHLLDLFLKVHKLFNLDYFVNIMNAMNFLEYYVYELKSADIKPNLKMLNLSKHLLLTVPSEQNTENNTEEPNSENSTEEENVENSTGISTVA